MPPNNQNKKANAKRIVELLEKTLTADIPISDAMMSVHGLAVPDHLQDPAKNPKQTVQLEEILVYQLVLKACAGNDKSIQEVLDRLVGKPAQYVESHSTQYTYIDFMAKCQADDLKAIDSVTTRTEQFPMPERDTIIDDDSDSFTDLLM